MEKINKFKKYEPSLLIGQANSVFELLSYQKFQKDETDSETEKIDSNSSYSQNFDTPVEIIMITETPYILD